jgi:cytochrome o ubiquinol oxidase subunit 1
MPLYFLGFMAMPRRLERYEVPEWQPYLIVAFVGACLILLGMIMMGIQIAVSIRQRNKTRDLRGDPWNGRTLEWATASPPPIYNFAVLPDVRELDALADMKTRGVAYDRPARYEDIYLPRNSAVGIVVGGFAFLLGFAMIWHIWWLAAACGLGLWAALALRASDDDSEICLTAAEVKEVEDQRFELLATAPRLEDADDQIEVGAPLTERPT